MEKLKSEVLRELEKQTGVEVRVDQASRILYSTDASIYQIKPLGVVFPFTADDLVGVVEFADKYKIPLIPRGSGTGLVGQAVGSGLIVDCSRHLNKIIEVDQESQTAIVEPGVILDDLNQAVGRYGLKYGPDPASSDRATLGGMIGNNSAGAHSIRYGMTSDHILSLDVVLSDGSVANFQRIPINLAKNFIDKTGPEGRLYQVCMDIRENYRGAIQDSWPLTWRRSSGYGINYLLPWSSSKPPFWQGVGEITSYPPIESDHINLAPLLVGSEGTLAVFLRAKLNLAKTSPQKILGILAFNEVTAACDAVPDILDLEPSAVELIPRSLISRARSIPAYASMLWFIDGDPDALLVVEFEGNDHKFLYEKIKKLGSNVIIAETTEQQEQVWAVRKVGLGLLMSISGDAKPLPFIEDVAVPVEKLGEYVRGIQYLLDQYGIEGNLYAHASAGCLHFRPLINTKTERGIIELRELAYEVGKLAKSLGGAISGEHGDGLARSELLELMFGSEIVEQFTRIKKAADPERILNPGKKVDPLPMDQNLRYGVMYEQKSWQPILDFSCQDSLSGAIEMCNGAGVCLSKTGVMCPSFQTTREEKHSTRGRANLLRFLISGNTPLEKIPLEMAHEALDLCLECKACKAECPSAVDMAKLKYEFLNYYYQKRARPLRDYGFAFINKWIQISRPFLGTLNYLSANRIIKTALEGLFGISQHRQLPKFTSGDDHALFQKGDFTYKEEVIFISDPLTEYVNPHVKSAGLRVINTCGGKVHSLPMIGAGRTMISKGFLPQAKEHAKSVVRAITDIDPDGAFPIIGLEPSEVVCFQDEYLDFFPGDEIVREIAKRTFSIEEFLLRSRDGGHPRYDSLNISVDNHSLLLHGHCYQKSQPQADDGNEIGTQATVTLFNKLGCQVEVIDAGCCGMSGSFGYEADHYNLSMKIGEERLFPAIQKKGLEQTIVAPGGSCRAHIKDGTGESASHPVEVLAELMSLN